MAERTTVRLPEELLSRARRKAAAEGRTLTSLIEDGLRSVLDRPNPENHPRRLPRVSQARGGLAPGMDLDRISAFEAGEDLAYAERLRGP